MPWVSSANDSNPELSRVLVGRDRRVRRMWLSSCSPKVLLTEAIVKSHYQAHKQEEV